MRFGALFDRIKDRWRKRNEPSRKGSRRWSRADWLERVTPKGGNVEAREVRRRRAANKRARASRKANRRSRA